MSENMSQNDMLAALRRGDITSERSKEYWSEEEREYIKKRYLAGVGISQIALELQRSENAVVQQLIAMKLLTPPGNHRQRSPKAQRCLCPRCRESECPYFNKEDGTCFFNNLMM